MSSFYCVDGAPFELTSYWTMHYIMHNAATADTRDFYFPFGWLFYLNLYNDLQCYLCISYPSLYVLCVELIILTC